MSEETTFYSKLQACKGLDLRDNRGKYHKLCYTLTSFTISLLRGRDGILSSIHRSMKNIHIQLCKILKVDIDKVVSRSHLPILLQGVNVEVFDELLFAHFNFHLTAKEKSWFAADGKTLKGSIPKGQKQGLNIIQVVEQESLSILNQSSYEGTKESEITCMRTLLSESGLESEKVTLDALHLCPQTTSQIAKAGGKYLISLKNNQPILFGQMSLQSELEPILHPVTTSNKGHGRLEKRTYHAYDLTDVSDKIDIDQRWNMSDLSTLIQVKRETIFKKTKEQYQEISFYLTNEKVENATQCYKAVRKHWSVEVSNHIRDVTLKEDKLRTKTNKISRVVALLRTLVINLLLKERPKNLIAQMELFQDDFMALITFLKKVKFL